MFKIFSSSIKFSTFFKSVKPFSSGNLYTWGEYSSGTGFSEPSTDPLINSPRRVPDFNSNVSKVSMGRWHTAVITTDGQLYTCGYGKKGSLGHQIHENYGAVKLVDFFKDKKVVDVACDGNYTVALTEDGKLWRWGAMKISRWPEFIQKLIHDIKPTQESFVDMVALPQLVPGFEGKQIISLNAGKEFVSVFTDKGVFNWGRGELGSFGDSDCLNYKTPTENQFLSQFLKHNHLQVVKAKSSGFSTVVLLSDGKLYGMGDNHQGQLGIRKNVGIVLDETVSEPTPIVDELFKGRKIVDFDLGENSLLILTDDNKVYFSGLNLICKPTLWDLPNNVKVKKLLASRETFAVLSTENKIYAFNENLFKNVESEFDYNFNVYEIENDVFGKGEILELGGRYDIRYAIVKN